MRRAAACVGLIVSLAAGSAAAREWTLVDIGTLGGPGSYGAAVSNGGVVAGCADVAAGPPHAFVYSNGSMRDLGPGCALAVNNKGTVAGRSGSGELVVWKDSMVTRLGIGGDVGDIGDDDTVVGTARSGAASSAFRYSNGTLVTFGGPDSFATGINSRGQIAGGANGHAFLHENGATRDLGTLGGAMSRANGINDRGEVVGMASNDFGQPQPFIYDGAMRALAGPGYSGAIAVNNHGLAVGSGEGIYGYLIDGNAYTGLDTLPDVAAKGWRHLEPKGINDRGWIVGTAFNAAGDLRAFLLVPKEARLTKPLRIAR